MPYSHRSVVDLTVQRSNVAYLLSFHFEPKAKITRSAPGRRVYRPRPTPNISGANTRCGTLLGLVHR